MLTKTKFLEILNQIFQSKANLLLTDEKKRFEETIKNIELFDQITADRLIKHLGLITIKGITDEDGYFKEFVNTIKNDEIESQTEIFYLLKGKQVSCLHTLDTVETWRWLGGDDVLIFILEKDKISQICLNANNLICTIPKNTLFGAKLASNNNENFVWVTCTCKPGFVPEYYKNPSSEELDFFTKTHPNYDQIIKELTPKNSSKNIMQSIIQFFSCCSKDRQQNGEQTPLISQTNS